MREMKEGVNHIQIRDFLHSPRKLQMIFSSESCTVPPSPHVENFSSRENPQRLHFELWRKSGIEQFFHARLTFRRASHEYSCMTERKRSGPHCATHLASLRRPLCAIATFSPLRSIQFFKMCRMTLPPDSCSILRDDVDNQTWKRSLSSVLGINWWGPTRYYGRRDQYSFLLLIVESVPVERPQDEGGGADLAAVPGADAAHHRVDHEIGDVFAEPPTEFLGQILRVDSSWPSSKNWLNSFSWSGRIAENSGSLVTKSCSGSSARFFSFFVKKSWRAARAIGLLKVIISRFNFAEKVFSLSFAYKILRLIEVFHFWYENEYQLARTHRLNGSCVAHRLVLVSPEGSRKMSPLL